MYIYKYTFEIVPIQKITIPDGASVLSMQLQNNVPTMWLMIPDIESQLESPLKQITLRIYGTGHEIVKNEKIRFIQTLQIDELVFHVFELVD